MEFIGKQIIFIGFVIVLIGLLFFSSDKLPWFGNTFADFSFKRENFKFYLPFGSMLILSLFLTIIINIFNKIFK